MAQQRNLFSFFKKGPETPPTKEPKQQAVQSVDAAVGGTRYAEEKNRANSGSPSSRQDKFLTYGKFFYNM
jgi:hypothetical protein